ncbi:MAG: hypothetical protein ACEQSX_00420 [Baekduiaceae bacterium]
MSTTIPELREKLNDLAGTDDESTDRQRAARASMLAREAIDALEELQRQPTVMDPNMGVSVAVDFSRVFDFGFIEGGPEDNYEPVGRRGLADAILDHAARLLIRDLDVAKDLARGQGPTAQVRKLAETMLRDEIQAQLTPLVTTAIATPRYKTNGYGEPIPGAEPVTLADLITAETMKFLSTKQNVSGSRTQMTPLEKIIAEQVSAAFDKQVGGAIAEAKTQAVAAVSARASKFLADNVVGLAIEQGTKPRG